MTTAATTLGSSPESKAINKTRESELAAAQCRLWTVSALRQAGDDTSLFPSALLCLGAPDCRGSSDPHSQPLQRHLMRPRLNLGRGCRRITHTSGQLS